jgi:hypothetical protein
MPLGNGLSNQPNQEATKIQDIAVASAIALAIGTNCIIPAELSGGKYERNRQIDILVWQEDCWMPLKRDIFSEPFA